MKVILFFKDVLVSPRLKGPRAVAVSPLTLNERKSRYLFAAKLSDKAANTMTIASIKAFRRIPKVMRKTLTVDNSKEFSSSNSYRGKPVFVFILLTLIRLGSVVPTKTPKV